MRRKRNLDNTCSHVDSVHNCSSNLLMTRGPHLRQQTSQRSCGIYIDNDTGTEFRSLRYIWFYIGRSDGKVSTDTDRLKRHIFI